MFLFVHPIMTNIMNMPSIIKLPKQYCDRFICIETIQHKNTSMQLYEYDSPHYFSQHYSPINFVRKIKLYMVTRDNIVCTDQ